MRSNSALRPLIISALRAPVSRRDGVGKCANSDAARVESGGAGMLSKKLVSAQRTPDLLREAEFAMLWPSNLRSLTIDRLWFLERLR